MWRGRCRSSRICGANHKGLLGVELSTDTAWRGGAVSYGPGKGVLCGTVSAGVVAAALMLALASSPAAAQGRYYYSPYYYPPSHFRHSHASRKEQRKETERVSKEPFGNMPKGPLQIFVSIDQQKLHFYSDGVHVEDEPVATGVPAHPTPMGVFSVIQRDRYHHSNIYSNAPMPFMERITWSGVALHEGVGLGHRASHGCIRMPHDFAARLWTLKTMGMRVIIARPELRPSAFADAHLFVHKAPPLAAAPTEAVKTAQTVDGGKTTDAAASAPIAAENAKAAADPPADAPAAAAPLKTDNLGLRVNTESAGKDPPAAANDAAKAPPPAAADAAAGSAAGTAAPAGADDAVPIPQVKPAALATSVAERTTPIAIFISRKTKKLYVRQNLAPLFDAAITIESPEQPLGTHVFTALAYLDDHTTFRWNVVSLPGEPPPARKVRKSEDDDRYDRHGRRHRRDDDEDKPAAELPPPQSPAAALTRIVIPQDVVDHVSELMVPGSSLVISDQGLGEETGEGTDFIVVTR
jgi:lipoprotein-anchoring transpeptidase ErfK/SrfK